MMPAGSVAALRETIFLPFLPERSCTVWATTSFPVPLAPRRSRWALRAATNAAESRSFHATGLSPTSPWESGSPNACCGRPKLRAAGITAARVVARKRSRPRTSHTSPGGELDGGDDVPTGVEEIALSDVLDAHAGRRRRDDELLPREVRVGEGARGLVLAGALEDRERARVAIVRVPLATPDDLGLAPPREEQRRADEASFGSVQDDQGGAELDLGPAAFAVVACVEGVTFGGHERSESLRKRRGCVILFREKRGAA
jgi:hypothetical protein